LEFGEDSDVAFEHAVDCIRGIQISANKLALTPKQGHFGLIFLRVCALFVWRKQYFGLFWRKVKRLSEFWPSFLGTGPYQTYAHPVVHRFAEIGQEITAPQL